MSNKTRLALMNFFTTQVAVACIAALLSFEVPVSGSFLSTFGVAYLTLLVATAIPTGLLSLAFADMAKDMLKDSQRGHNG